MGEVLKFKKGDRACMLVMSIIENVKGFSTVSGYRYRHDITLMGDDKKMYLGEYLTPEATQAVFKQGQKACFECRDHGVIMPVGSPEEWETIGDNILLARVITGESFVHAITHAAIIHAAKIAGGQSVEIKDLLGEADLINEWLLNKQKRALNIIK